MKRFVALYDLHYGFERKGGHRTPLHDLKALNVVMKFIKDFKPHVVILGGDMLDCAAISHHTKHKPGQTEGLRIRDDAQELSTLLIRPLERLLPKSKLVYIEGNHEKWLDDLVVDIPGLEGLIDPRTVLRLGRRWQWIPQGGAYKLGKLVFIHGDQVSGGEHAAKAATVAYEANVRFGHFHTHQTYTKTAAVDANGHTGVCVPCLCKKGPGYGGRRPNRWIQGFQWGYVGSGIFNDYTTVIINGKAYIGGKLYQ
jgi:hypothetical protein